MKIHPIIIAVLIMTLTSGCATLLNRPENKFPGDIKGICHGSKNEAERLIESKGHKLKAEADCKVIKTNGERKFSGIWAWHDTGWNMYVCGLCNGETIWIGCNPNTGQEIHVPTLTHEMGHHWLMTTLGDNTHNKAYDDCFFNWKYSREVTGRSSYFNSKQFKKTVKDIYDSMEEGQILSINEVGDEGEPITHIDFIVIHK